jgi:hypothetical protein
MRASTSIFGQFGSCPEHALSIHLREPASLGHPSRSTGIGCGHATPMPSVAHVEVPKRVVVAASGTAAAPEAPTGAARARIVPAEFLDQLFTGAQNAFAALYLRLTRGNPRRRLLVGSKGRLDVTLLAHGAPPDEHLAGRTLRHPWRPRHRILWRAAARHERGRAGLGVSVLFAHNDSLERIKCAGLDPVWRTRCCHATAWCSKSMGLRLSRRC